MANPVPLEEQLDPALHDRVLAEALRAAEREGVTGQAITPFLLEYLVRGTDGASLEANLAAVRGNARARRRDRRVLGPGGSAAARGRGPIRHWLHAAASVAAGVGDVVTDVVARHADPPAVGTDTAADIVLRPGGSGANTAAWAAHLGADARLLARVGRDTGEWHTRRAAAPGSRPHVRVDPDHPTAVVIAMVDVTGERTMLTNRGAGGRIGAGDWDDALLDGVRPSAPVGIHAVRRARAWSSPGWRWPRPPGAA